MYWWRNDYEPLRDVSQNLHPSNQRNGQELLWCEHALVNDHLVLSEQM